MMQISLCNMLTIDCFDGDHMFITYMNQRTEIPKIKEMNKIIGIGFITWVNSVFVIAQIITYALEQEQ